MSGTESIVIDGYDVLAEPPRLAGAAARDAPDRNAARVAGPLDGGPVGTARGHFLSTAQGLALDLDLDGGRRLLDEQGPRYRDLAAAADPDPVALQRLAREACARALPALADPIALAAADGPQALARAVTLARTHARERFLARHGAQTLARVHQALGGEAAGDEARTFLVVASAESRHGPALAELPPAGAVDPSSGLASLAFNGEPDELEQRLDTRSPDELLADPAGLPGLLAAGRLPVELLAAVVLDVVPGDERCGLADLRWVRELALTCQRHQVLLCCDEEAGFGRTGRLFAIEHTGVTPDLLCAARSTGAGLLIARGDLVAGSGPQGAAPAAPDLARALATWTLLHDHAEPAFEGRGLLQNSAIKGEYLRMRLAELSAEHPELFEGFSGLAGVWGLEVMLRGEVLAEAGRQGLLLRPCGPDGDIAGLRLLLLADVLTHEIDELVAALGRTFRAVEEAHPDL